MFKTILDLLQRWGWNFIFLTRLHILLKKSPLVQKMVCKEELIRGGAKFDAACFVACASNGELPEVELFTGAGIRLNMPSTDGDTALFAASRYGHENVVYHLLSLPEININAKNHVKDTALIVAAREGHQKIVAKLLQHPDINVNARNRKQDTPLIAAARGGHIEVFRALLMHGADLNHCNEDGQTAWIAAIRSRCGDIEREIEARGAKRDGVDMWRKRIELEDRGVFNEATFVHRCQMRQLSDVRDFLTAGINVNGRGSGGNTGLIVAAKAGYKELVELLLAQAKIDLNATNESHDTALIVAARQGEEGVVRLLLEPGKDVNVNATNDVGESAMLEAAKQERQEIVELLQRAGATHPNLEQEVARWKIENSPLQYNEPEFLKLVSQQRTEWVKTFLEAGISVKARDESLNTALILASDRNDKKIMDLLIKDGVKLNAFICIGDTALIVAARNGRKDAIIVLLKAEGIDVNATNDAGESAMLEAAKQERQEIVELLQRAGATHPNLEQEVARWRLLKEGLWGEVEFVLAAARGKTEEARRFYLAGMDPNARDLRGNTGLILASRNNQIDTVRLLLGQDGIDINARSDDNTSALMAAAGREHQVIVALLLEAGANRRDLERALRWRIEDRGHCFDVNAFVRMAAKGQDGLVSLYIEAGMAVDAANEDGNTSLILAAEEGETKVVQVLLERGADVDFRNRSGSTALEVALRKGHKQVAELLKQHGASVPQLPALGLLRAVEIGDAAAVRRALEAGASPNQKNEAGEPALVIAIRVGLREIATLLLDWGADPEGRDAHGKTPLMVAAELGSFDFVTILLERGVAVDAIDTDSSTSLIMAARHGRTEIVELLLDKGADINSVDSAGRTPLMSAIMEEHDEVEKALECRGAEQGAAQASLLRAVERGDLKRVRELLDLLSEGAVRSARGKHNRTPLMLAAARGWHKTVKALVAGNGGIDLIDSSGNTALMLAAGAGRKKVVEILIEAGAKIDLRNSRGQTALLQAAAAGKGKVVKLLVNRGANASLAADGTTPLVEACRYGPAEVVKALIDAEADVNQWVGFGTSALMAATLAGQEGIIELLEAEKATAGRQEARLFRCVRMGDEQGFQSLAMENVKIDARDEIGRTVLLEAAERGQVATVERLLEAGASPDVKALNGDTALKLAVASGSLSALVVLIENTKRDEKGDTAALLAASERGFAAAAGLLVEKSDARIDGIESGRVPLVVAAARGHLDVVATLLELKADKDKRSANGQTALTAARLHGHQEIVDLLQSSGAQAATDEVELLVAAADGDLEMLGRLLARPSGVKLNAQDELGRTALMLSCEKRRLRVVEMLLAHAGSDQKRRQMISTTDLRGRTPLMWAAVGGERQIVFLLLQHDSATLGARSTKKDRTALMEACYYGWSEVVEELLDAMEEDQRSAAVNAKDKDGKTPLGEAFRMAFEKRQQSYLRIVDLLEDYEAKLGRDEMEFLDAARRCDPERLLSLVDRVEVDVPRRKGKTALMLAVETDCAEAAQILVDEGANVNQRGPFDATPLILAARAGKMDGLRFLLAEHAEYDLRNSLGDTALFAAVKAGLNQPVEALLAERANAELPDLQGRTPLMQAVIDERPDLVERLLEAKASNDRVDRYGRTALTLAHLRGESSGLTEDVLETAWQALSDMGILERLLLESGTRRGWNEAELLLAAHAGDGNEVSRILEKKVVVHTPDLGGNTALLWACRHGDGPLVQKLMEAGANPDVSNDEGLTPLIQAVAHGDPALVEALLRPGLNLDAQDKDGDTALLNAARRGYSDLITLLVNAGADVNLGNRKRQTPLLASARHSDLAAVRLLIDRGANACGRSIDHHTAVMETAVRGDEAMLEALLKHVDARLRYNEKTAFLNAVARVEGSACTAFDLAEKGGHLSCVALLRQHGGRPVRLTGYTVYLTEHGDFYHRYKCGACSHGRKHNNLEEIEIDSPRIENYPPCDRCNPSYRESKFNWSCL